MIHTTKNHFVQKGFRGLEQQYFSINIVEGTIQKGDMRPCKKCVIHPIKILLRECR